MPSFDIASEVDLQILDNAVNTVKKEISTRFDFRGSPVTVELNKKDYTILLEVESDMKMKQLIDVLISRTMKQDLLELSETSPQNGHIRSKSVFRVGGFPHSKQKNFARGVTNAQN